MSVMKNDPLIEKLKLWLEMAEEDSAAGDRDALSGKLLLLRAEIENALGLGRVKSVSPAQIAVVPAKLAFKYAFATLLLLVAFGLAIQWKILSGGPQFTAAPAPIAFETGAAIPAPADSGSEESAAALTAPIEIARAEVPPPGGEAAGAFEPSEGRRGGITRGRGIERRNPERGSTPAAAASTPEAPSPASSAPPAESAPAVPASEAAPAERPKLDPLALVSALDSHFD
ncbi:MAG: hypothetical protein HRF49_03845 [bacterium]|jgi:hypothetical protein